MSNLDYPLRTFQTAQGVDLNSHTVGGDEDLRAYANGDTRAFAAVALAATQTVGAGRIGFVRMNAADFGRPQSGTRIIYVSQQVLEGLAALGSVGQMIRDNASKTAEAEKGTISALLCPSPDLFVSAIVLLTGIHTIGNLEPLRLPYFGRFLRMVGFNNIPRLLATAQWLQGSSDRLDNFLLVGGTKPQQTEDANAKWFATAQEAELELTKGSVLVFAPSADHYALHLRVPCIVVGTITYSTDQYTGLRLSSAVTDSEAGSFVALDGLNVTPYSSDSSKGGELLAPSWVISHCRLQAEKADLCEGMVLRAVGPEDAYANQITLHMSAIGAPGEHGSVVLESKYAFVHGCGVCAPLFLRNVYGAHVQENVLYAPIMLRDVRGGPGSVFLERNVVPGEDIDAPPSWTFSERNGLSTGYWLSMDQHTWSTAMPFTKENRVREDLVQAGLDRSVGESVLAILLAASAATSGVFVDWEVNSAGSSQEVTTVAIRQGPEVVVTRPLCKLFVVLSSSKGNPIKITKPVDVGNGPGGVMYEVDVRQHAGLRPFVNASHGVLLLDTKDPALLPCSLVVNRAAFLSEPDLPKMQLAHAIDKVAKNSTFRACLPAEMRAVVLEMRRAIEAHAISHVPPALSDATCARAMVPGPEPDATFNTSRFLQYGSPPTI